MTANRRPGRPRLTTPNKRANLYLDAETLAKAKQLGDGSASKGVKRAVAAMPVPAQAPSEI